MFLRKNVFVFVSVYIYLMAFILFTSNSPDAPSVRPVANRPRVDHQMTVGLLEKEMVLKSM